MNRVWKAFFGSLLMMGVAIPIAAQQPPTTPAVQCNETLLREMTPDSPYQDTILNVPAGTQINLTISPLGASFNPIFFLQDTGGGEMLRQNTVAAGIPEELISYAVGSSNPTLRVLGAPADYVSTITRSTYLDILSLLESDIRDGDSDYRQNNLGGVGLYFGAYTISLTCRPFGNPSPTFVPPDPTGQPPVTPTLSPDFSGFPGLPPVDFSNAFVFPLALGQANPGQIPAGADAVISYTFDGQAGQALDLTFTRTIGNLNLGLVVLNAENQVVFQASLVAADRVNAQLTLPTSGTYTIGVFRIDLLPPATPEATGFQIEAALG